VWADFDEGPPTALPLPPSFVIETSPNKYQALWLLDAPTPDLQRIETVNRSIAILHDGDLNACDRARVLRLPGFRNLKYRDSPMSRLVMCQTDRRFTLEELERGFPVQSTAPLVRPSSIVQCNIAPSWLTLVFDAIVDYLVRGGYFPRSAWGDGVMARCPLHDDHNPSLSLHPVRGWKCFGGCGAGRLTLLAARLGVQVRTTP